MIPPATESTTASIRNCERISVRCAPMAFLMPISRVRSVTDTSMIFMMPMPPTSSDIAAIPESSIVMTLITSFITSMIAFWLMII